MTAQAKVPGTGARLPVMYPPKLSSKPPPPLPSGEVRMAPPATHPLQAFAAGMMLGEQGLLDCDRTRKELQPLYGRQGGEMFSTAA